MEILNSKEVDKFLWEHKENGCVGIAGHLFDDEGLLLNVAWRDQVTGEQIDIEYAGLVP